MAWAENSRSMTSKPRLDTALHTLGAPRGRDHSVPIDVDRTRRSCFCFFKAAPNDLPVPLWESGRTLPGKASFTGNGNSWTYDAYNRIQVGIIPVSASSMTVTLKPSSSRMRLAHSHPRGLLDLLCVVIGQDDIAISNDEHIAAPRSDNLLQTRVSLHGAGMEMNRWVLKST